MKVSSTKPLHSKHTVYITLRANSYYPPTRHQQAADCDEKAKSVSSEVGTGFLNIRASRTKRLQCRKD